MIKRRTPDEEEEGRLLISTGPIAFQDDANVNEAQNLSLGFKSLWNYLRLLRIGFSDQRRRIQWFIFILLLLSSILTEIIIYFLGTTTSRYYKVLNGPPSPAAPDLSGGSRHDNFKEFQWLLIQSIGLFVSSAIVKSFTHLMGGYFALNIRLYLTHKLHAAYFTPQTFHSINLPMSTAGSDSISETIIDSPDQRIADDASKFAESTRTLIEKLILTPIMIIYYSIKTYSVAGWYSLGIIFTYFLLTSATASALSNRLVSVIYGRERTEGHFRYLHVRIRKYAESISFLRGFHDESERLNRTFDQVNAAHRRYINLQFPVQIVTTFTSEFGAILSFIIIAIPIYTSKLDGVPADELAELISVNAFFSMYLINKLTNITELFTLYSDIAGYTARLTQILDISSSTDSTADSSRSQDDEDVGGDKDVAVLDTEPFALRLNSRILLIPAFHVSRGDFVVVQGPNGAGKTSFLRILAGLIPHQLNGVVPASNAMYLPQTPYLLSNASMHDQLRFPHIDRSLNDDLDLEDAQNVEWAEMKKNLFIYLGLNSVTIPTADKELKHDPKDSDWFCKLSPGEQQKLAFARTILHYSNPLSFGRGKKRDSRCEIIFIDEATCHMDAESEEKCIGWCVERAWNDLQVAVVWITHDNRTQYKPNKVISF